MHAAATPFADKAPLQASAEPAGPIDDQSATLEFNLRMVGSWMEQFAQKSKAAGKPLPEMGLDVQALQEVCAGLRKALGDQSEGRTQSKDLPLVVLEKMRGSAVLNLREMRALLARAKEPLTQKLHAAALDVTLVSALLWGVEEELLAMAPAAG